MRIHRILATSTFALLISGVMTVNAAPAAENDEKGVKAANAQFYAALNELFKGKVEPMKQVWSHRSDVTYMGPVGGILVGWDRVLASWELQAAKKLAGEVKCENVHITAGRDVAVVCCRIVGTNYVDGKPQKVSIRATSTYRKENGKWKMIGHHTDLLSFLNE